MLALAALFALVYAVGRHKVAVLVPAEPPEAAPAAPVEPPPAFDPTAPPSDPFALPPGLAAAPPAEAVEPQIVLKRETDVILETTRAGLILREDGTIEQTYTGRPPEACPT